VSDGIIIYDKCGIPLVDEDSPLVRLHEEGEVTVPAQSGQYNPPGQSTVDFAPCAFLPMVTLMDIDAAGITYIEDLCSFVALGSKNGSNQWYRMYIYNYSTSTKKFKWRVWVRN